VAYTYNLSAFDVNNNGLVELPVAGGCTDADCSNVNPNYEYTKQQVLKHTITHEMGHGVGAATNSTHTTDAACVMYQYSNNWSRDNRFSNTAIGRMLFHK
jgi:hypothetical protein